MVRDVTRTWAEERTREGLYIVRCTKPEFEDRVRIGAGGNKGGTSGIFGRLTKHSKPWRDTPECETHVLQPFEVVHAWALDGWTQEEINDGERCLWRAFLVRFPKHRGRYNDKSIFLVPTGSDLNELIAVVEADLEALARVNESPAPVVEVPHEVTAVRRRVRTAVPTGSTTN